MKAELKVPIYDHTIYIHVGSDLDLNDYNGILVDEALKVDISKYSGAIFECQNNSESLFYLEKFDINNSKDISVLAHECLHLTFYILSNASINYSIYSEEAYTYLHGYLVDQIITLIK
jgi:hypothetical protein